MQGRGWVLEARLLMLISALGVSLDGCSVGITRFNELMSQRIRTRAAFDFNCSGGAIQVTPMDGRSFGATGCGHRAVYLAQPAICNPSTVTEAGIEMYCSAVLNSDSVDRASAPDSTSFPPPVSVPASAVVPAPGTSATAGCAVLPWGDPGITDGTVDSPLPRSQPGSVEDGIYVLSSYEWHVPGNHPATRHGVFRVAGSQIELAFTLGSESPVPQRGMVRFAPDGTMNVAITCPRPGVTEFNRYAVTPTGVLLISTVHGTAATFTRVHAEDLPGLTGAQACL